LKPENTLVQAKSNKIVTSAMLPSLAMQANCTANLGVRIFHSHAYENESGFRHEL